MQFRCFRSSRCSAVNPLIIQFRQPLHIGSAIKRSSNCKRIECSADSLAQTSPTMAAKRARHDPAVTAALQSVLHVGGISNSGLDRVLRVLKKLPEFPEVGRYGIEDAFHVRWNRNLENTQPHHPTNEWGKRITATRST